jgi:hypothetical protein
MGYSGQDVGNSDTFCDCLLIAFTDIAPSVAYQMPSKCIKTSAIFSALCSKIVIYYKLDTIMRLFFDFRLNLIYNDIKSQRHRLIATMHEYLTQKQRSPAVFFSTMLDIESERFITLKTQTTSKSLLLNTGLHVTEPYLQ